MQNLTAIYLRLSRDDEKNSESESITNQKTFLLDYAGEHNLNVVEVFSDDGYSGITYNRPAFKRMIDMVEAKKINTIITKDLSRLGRDYIQTGYYLEQYFPIHNIRYIAVTDGIDTYKDGAANDLSPFRAVFNDMYAKDISKKVRTALDTKKRNGRFIGSSAPYGYKKDPNDRNHLLIDEEAAYYVQKIYREFLAGNSILGIAKMMSEKNIPTPSAYKHHAENSGIWNDGIIRRILSNPTYAGNITQNTTRKINYKVNKRVRVPRDQWITVLGTHGAIISQEDFDTAARLLSKRRYSKKIRGGDEHMLTGLVFCGGCGAPMSVIRESSERTYLVCSKWRREAAESGCTSHCIRESYVEQTVKNAVKKLISETFFYGAVRANTEIKNICELSDIDRSILVMLVDRIVVEKNKKLDIYVTFKKSG